MKNLCLTLCLLLAMSWGQRAMAQLPVESTAAEPVWYYIKVLGSDNGREGRVWTAEGTETVSGRAQAEVADPAAVYPQLWRFEKDAEGYIIINRATGKQVDVVYDAERDISHAILRDEAATRFAFNPLGDYFQLESSIAPEGGIASEVYMHQANAGGSRDYVIMMVGTTYATGLNSSFSFELFEDFEIEYSTADAPVWYRIASAKAGVESKCMAENADAQAAYPLLVSDEREGDNAQQWRVELKDAATGTVALVNRGSGRVVLTQSVADGLYNLTQLGTAAAAGNGWLPTYLGQGQYTLSGAEEDGIVRYLNASVEGEEPEAWSEDALLNSGFAWKFQKVETPTAITQSVADRLAVSVVGGRIVVEGAADYRIVTPEGIVVPRGAVLRPGIYIIQAAGFSKSIVIK